MAPLIRPSRPLLTSLVSGIASAGAALPIVTNSSSRRKNDGTMMATKLPSAEDTLPVTVRSQAEHAALISSLQEEFGDDITAPQDSSNWPTTLMRRWFQDGGHLTMDALSCEPPSQITRRLIDQVGATLPAVELDLLRHGNPAEDGLLGALRHDGPNAPMVAQLCERLLENDCVACQLGAPMSFYGKLRAEGTRAWPAMRPGELRSSDDGTIVAGRAPSGEPRGDRHVLLRELLAAEAESASSTTPWPSLRAADEALGVVAAAISSQLRRVNAADGLGALGKRSDSFVAIFPGADGLGYGAHFDGDEACRLTMLLYTSEDWRPEHGGSLRLLDESKRVWHEVAPRADRLVIFRSEKVLHKVMPCFKSVPRLALTVFLSEGTTAEEAEKAAVLSALAFSA